MPFAFILYHGWGCNGHYWINMIQSLQNNDIGKDDIFVCDAGYYNSIPQTDVKELLNFVSKKKAEGKKIIGAGHSLGFSKLLIFMNDGVEFDKLIGIQSSINCLGDNYEDVRIGFEEYFKKLKENTSQILQGTFSFLKHEDIKESFFDERNINKDLVIDDFEKIFNKLGYLFKNLKKVDYHIIVSNDDYLVPLKVTRSNFPEEKIIICDLASGHSLGYVNSDWVVKKILEIS